MSDTAVTQGAHHIGLTVPELAKTRAFFLDTLGFSQVGEVPDYPAVFLTDGTTMITLWQAENPATAVSFDRKNVIGLLHLAMKVADGDSLDALHQELTTADGVEIIGEGQLDRVALGAHAEDRGLALDHAEPPVDGSAGPSR